VGGGKIDNGFAPSSCTFVAATCPPVFSTENILSTFDTGARGYIGGAQIGYNYQTNKIVWGIEADFQGANINGSASAGAVMPLVVVPGDIIVVTGTGSEKIDWFGTLRGRLGWTATPPLLVYATGGLAYGHTQTSATFSGAILNDFAGPANGSSSFSQSDTRVGFTVGGGLEWMFAPRWSVKAEYLYYDLGKVTLNQTLSIALVALPADQANSNIQSVAHYNGSIARAGVNYHF